MQGSPRRAPISLKPLRREARSVSAEPVCSCAVFLVHFAHETVGAARTRSSLRPLFPGGTEFDPYLGRTAPRERERIFECGMTSKMRRWGRSQLTSAFLGRCVPFMAFRGPCGTFIDPVTLAAVVEIPSQGDRADQDETDQQSPTSHRHNRHVSIQQR